MRRGALRGVMAANKKRMRAAHVASPAYFEKKGERWEKGERMSRPSAMEEAAKERKTIRRW